MTRSFIPSFTRESGVVGRTARRGPAWRCIMAASLLALAGLVVAAQAQDTATVRLSDDSVRVRFLDADLRGVIQSVGRYLPKPVVAGGVPGVRVSLETPEPVSRASLATLLAALVEAQGLEYAEDSVFIRIGPRPTAPPVAASPMGAVRDPSQVRLFVVRLKHARAGDVAATVNLLFGGSGAFSGGSGLSAGTLSQELERNAVQPQTPPAPPPPAPGSGAQTTARAAMLSGSVTIVPDQLTNSLLVRATPEDFAVLTDAIDQLDIRPLQVLIEVLIVEARHDRNFSLGADLTLPPKGVGDDGTVSGTVTGGGLGDLVIRIMRLGHLDLDAMLRTSQSRGDVEIVSRPVLLASNNTEARFLVGSQRPFVQVSRSLPTDAPSRDQVVQYRDVGTKLSVRPTINQDGYVSLVIQQEINAATGETQFDAPVISTREAATQVLVKDGQTIVLGGLRDLQKDRGQSGVPVLSGLPIVGGLFGTASRRSSSTELYLFLTPRILKTDADADSVTSERLPRAVIP
jgi:type II secretory pathway component GspD/PulD (secretin)